MVEMENVVGLHWWLISTARSAMSGSPVAFPALSLQLARFEGSTTNSAVEPTMAVAFLQASIVPLVVSSGVSLESHVRTLICRQPTPPLALTVLAQACT